MNFGFLYLRFAVFEFEVTRSGLTMFEIFDFCDYVFVVYEFNLMDVESIGLVFMFQKC